MTRLALPKLMLVSALAVLAACQSGGDDAAAGAADDTAAAPVAAAAPDSAAPAGAGAPAVAAGGMLDPNAATREELMAIPGMDAALADSLVAKRPFENMLAVDRVLAARLSETQRDSVYTRLWKPIDLNSASGDEIMLIPGVGNRMRHEFEEYRPYRSMEQFRREIGKYVNEAEVARLERYVMIKQ
jgi:DNA uptake protein ComE-like DNA-binding protein